ncbi:MAG: energy transducer TonB, partial [Chitinophagaceae bacterium]
GRITAHTVFEKKPIFPGGEAGLLHYLSSEIRYPNKARKKGIQREVIIDFIVNENGTVSNVKIIQSVSNEIDNEAVRVVKRMPRWQPGMHDGKDVKVSYELPVRFRLE